jgi:hypothetical protein
MDNSKEVTFHDLDTGVAKNKAGYRKIQFCEEKAAADGLQYFWIATCCIDKRNLTELSETITSMFRWYQKATRCYVYLSDVSIYGQGRTNLSLNYPWESAFRQSRWFTRSWTLQELIAPTSVEFFSSEGERLGNKSTMEVTIHEITGIAKEAFKGLRPLSDFSVKERMAWAEQRNTKLEEDQVYSLLGIFTISMPLIYGEGKENALKRLIREIDESSKGM